MPISEPGPVYTPRAKWLPWWLRWRIERKRRRDEEFRLFRLACVTGDSDDTRAWLELKEENHALGVW
ncbi:hypothetical protein SEA_LAZERLEMON_67 [Streptomyces phage LazerLemon]|nr:hypothetical protein SEA_LAZERLEMON_67 [Streptomyces phage LazerLemon]